MALSGGRSLSGTPLVGEKLVRLVYMDEAGIANPEHEPFVVVSGVIVHGDAKLNAAERALDDLVRAVVPEEHQEDFVFHASELFNGGKKVFKRKDPDWPDKRRDEVGAQLAALPKALDLPLVFGWVERKGFPRTVDDATAEGLSIKEKTKGAHATAFLTCAQQVEMWMHNYAKDENCILVIENNDQHRGLINEVQSIYRKPAAIKTLYKGNVPTDVATWFPFQKIKHRPLWETKEPSSVLQLADFCAYVLKKKLMKNPRFDQFFPPIAHQLALPLAEFPWVKRRSWGEQLS